VDVSPFQQLIDAVNAKQQAAEGTGGDFVPLTGNSDQCTFIDETPCLEAMYQPQRAGRMEARPVSTKQKNAFDHVHGT
jgi:hypothetical protein